MPATIDHVLRWWGREQAGRIAFAQDDDEVSYAELDAWVGRVAHRFFEAGVGVGDRVSVYAANSLEWCVAALATLRCGGVLAGIHANMVTAEVAYLLGDYAPAVLLTDPAGAERLAGLGELVSKTGEPVRSPLRLDVGEIAALRHGQPADVRVEADPQAVAVIVTTSGSTARPKGVMYSNRTLIDAHAALMLEDPIEVPHPTMLILPPFSTSAGLLQIIHTVLQGGSGYVEPRFDPDRAVRLIGEKRISVLRCGPIFHKRMIDSPEFARTDVSCVKVAYTGGAAVPVPLLQIWAERGVLVRQIYGQTECGGFGVINPRRYALSHPDKCGYGSVMRDMKVVDAEGRTLPPGEVGEIRLRGVGMMLGYWNNPQATAETLIHGWLHTGDLGVIDELGLLKFVDRKKDIIISGGLNISAAEVERVVMDYPGVEEAAVLAAPDDAFGETPFAVVYGPAAIDVAALIAHCDRNLSKHKTPRYVVVSETPLPRLAAGKVSKPALRQIHLDGRPLPERVR